LNKKIAYVTDYLGLSDSLAAALLLRHNWSQEKVTDEYSANENLVS